MRCVASCHEMKSQNYFRVYYWKQLYFLPVSFKFSAERNLFRKGFWFKMRRNQNFFFRVLIFQSWLCCFLFRFVLFFFFISTYQNFELHRFGWTWQQIWHQLTTFHQLQLYWIWISHEYNRRKHLNYKGKSSGTFCIAVASSSSICPYYNTVSKSLQPWTNVPHLKTILRDNSRQIS